MSETTDTNEDVSGLKNKINELLATVKSEKARADKAERDKEEAADAASSANSTELEKMQKRAEKAERDLAAANATAETNAKSLRDYKRDASITQAIAAANVDAKHVGLLTKALRADVEFSDDGEPLIEGKTVDGYIKAYTAPKGEGHWMVRAPNNTGGLATGNDGSNAGEDLWSKPPTTPEEHFKLAKLSTENPVAFNAAMDRFGTPDRKVSV